jgi:hypothetical protein
VTHDSLHGRQVGSAHEQQRGGRVAEMVEADLPDLADREELEAALRTATQVRVSPGLAVPAALAPTLVDVAGDETGPAHRTPQDLLELRVLRQHAAVLRREDQLRRRGSNRTLQVHEQLGADRNRVDAAALRNVAVVRAADHDETSLEVHVRLAQREQLALSHASVDRRREHVLPLRLERREQGRHLGRPQVVGQPLHHLPLGHVGHRIRPRELLHPPRHRERPAHVAAQVVHAPRAEGVFLAGQEEIDLPRRHVGEYGRTERRPDDVLPDARLTSSGARLAQELLDPPLHQLVDGAAATLELQGLEAEALPLVATLQLDRESLRSPLGGRRGCYQATVTTSADHLQVPGATLQIDGRHGYCPSLSASRPSPADTRIDFSIVLPSFQSTVL